MGDAVVSVLLDTLRQMCTPCWYKLPTSMQVSSVLAPSCASSFVHTCMHIQHKLPTIFGDVVVSVITLTLANVYARDNLAPAVVIALVVHTVYACTCFTVVATIYRSNHSALSTMC